CVRADRRVSGPADRRVGGGAGVDGQDLVGTGVADDVEPAPAADTVAPALGEGSAGVVAEEEVLRPLLVGQGARVLRVRHVRLSAVPVLGLVAWSAPGTRQQQHRFSRLGQCATAAAPCSSTSAPVMNRSSPNGRLSSWGSPVAIVWAITQPALG